MPNGSKNPQGSRARTGDPGTSTKTGRAAAASRRNSPNKPIGTPVKTRTAYVVSHTHWDREWRYPLWETRWMLLDFMDELVGVLESGKYPGFLLDGQVAPVVDYLEIRPEMTDRVKALVASGRLLIGPWYTLPDEYPVDGEALVRNLLWGHRKARALGRVFNVGYTPFGWGQTAQLPQLYAGFGMDVAMIGKRVGTHRAPHCEFLWRGPDGTDLLTTRFGDWGRQNFYFYVHLSALFGCTYLGPEWTYDWEKGGLAYHRADREHMEQDHFRLDPPARWFPESLTPEMIEQAWKTMDDSLLPGERLMMNGCDYTAAQSLFPEMMDRLNALDRDTDRQWVHTTMDRYVDRLRRSLDRNSLPVVEGELRDGPAGATTGNALSTRLYLKRLNKKAQTLLLRHAEPLSLMASLSGAPYPAALLTKAWEFLLLAHPHDSINGVTQDKTARDVASRLDQVIDISESAGNRAMQELTRRIDRSRFAEQDILLVAFNPLPYPRREVLEAWVNVPDPGGSNSNWPPISTSLEVVDATGRAVGTQWQGATREIYPVAELHARARPFNCQRHRLFFDTGEIPAGGYRVYRVEGSDETKPRTVPWGDHEARTGSLLTGPNVLENEFLRVEMNPNGTFDLADKGTGRTFHQLNSYEDRGEHGDYWISRRPMFDQGYTSVGCAARIWAEDAGPLQATLVSEITLQIPVEGNLDRHHRSPERSDLTIRTAATLRAGEEHVDVRVSFENRHKNHWLRAMFPTGLHRATHADAGGHFTVDRRPIRPQGPADGTVWPDMATLPQNNFLDVSDGEFGLAFLNDSLTEYEVTDTPARTVALSLLRSVRNWLCTEHRVGSNFPSQDGGQCLGWHTIHYAIRPHRGNWQAANLPLAAERFNVPPIPVQTRGHRGTLPAGGASLFQIDNPHLRFSTAKKAEDRKTLLVRVYNPTDQRQTGRILLAGRIRRAWLVTLNEKRQSQLPRARKGSVAISAEPNQIVTVEIEVALR